MLGGVFKISVISMLLSNYLMFAMKPLVFDMFGWTVVLSLILDGFLVLNSEQNWTLAGNVEHGFVIIFQFSVSARAILVIYIYKSMSR